MTLTRQDLAALSDDALVDLIGELDQRVTLSVSDVQELGLMLDTLADWLAASGGHGLPAVKTKEWSIRLLAMAHRKKAE